MTKDVIEKQVKDTMMSQQTLLLEIAGRNALKLVQDQQKKAAPSLLDLINVEVETARKHDHREWRTQVNKENFNTLHQVEQMWKRTERFVSALEVQHEQAELKAATMDAIAKGKKLTHDRLKVIRYADRDGWQAALHFIGDDIAETAEEEKKMRKAKKETDKTKEASQSKSRDKRKRSYSGRDGQGSSRDREPWEYPSRSSKNSYFSGSNSTRPNSNEITQIGCQLSI